MRRIRYQVACSLDGYIAKPQGEFDWIIHEPSFDFEALHNQFDTIIMGRRTYEVAYGIGDFPGKQVIVASQSLRQEDHLHVEVVGDGLEARVRELRSQSGRDIWLYGGGDLLSQFLSWDLVDMIEPAIIPILLGDGIPLVAALRESRNLTLVGTKSYPTGMVLLEYKVNKMKRNWD